MKKIILTLLAFPMFLVSCAEKGDDANLQGTWVGDVKISDVEALRGLNKEMLAFNEKLATETYVFKFKDRSVQIYKAKNTGSLDNKIELEIGEYKAEENTLDISIKATSCASNDGKNFGKTLQSKRKATYRLGDTLNELTLNFGINNKIELTKREGQDELDIENSIEQSEVGCFVGSGKFEKNKPQKPKKQINLEAKLEEIKKQTQEADSNTQPRVEY